MIIPNLSLTMFIPAHLAQWRLETFEIFHSLVQSKSFSATAKHFHRTQGSISHIVKQMETDLGFQLIHRSSRAFSLTHQGVRFVTFLDQVLPHMASFFKGFVMQDHAQKTKLEITASSIPGEYLLPKFIFQFQEAHPEIEIHLTISDTAQAFAAFHDHSVQYCAIGSVKNVDPDLFEWKVLGEDMIVIIAAKNHPIFQNPNWNDIPSQTSFIRLLCAYPWVFREPGSATRDWFFDQFPQARQLPITLELQNNTALLQTVQNSHALSVISDHAIIAAGMRSNLRILKHSFLPPLSRQLFLVRKKQRPYSPDEELFWRYIP